MKNQRFFAGVLLVCLLAASTAFAQVQTPRYIQMSEATKAYYEYLPEGYPTSMSKYPLMIFVHGLGEVGDGTTTTLPYVLRNGPPKLINEGSFPTSFTSNGQTFRFIILSPQFTWFPSVNDIENVINYAIANYPVDINRVYLTGLSMGGAATWYYPGGNTYYANRLAAIVPVCGATDPYTSYANNIAATNLPVWATHNSGDPQVNVSVTNTLIDLINNRPSPPNPLAKKTIFNVNGHDAWTQTYSPSFRENGMNVYEWMLQYTRTFAVLPVDGLSFSVQLQDNKKVGIQWKTTAENNVAGFAVLRSTDGNNFTEIGFVPAAGVNGAGALYHFTDNLPLKGRDFYRIEVRERDGSKTYSEVRSVDVLNNTVILINPNPVKDVINLQTNTTLQNATLQVFNATGQQLLQKIVSGSSNIPVSIPDLKPGIYIAVITQSDTKQKHTIKFVKE
ncbi:MAG: T9SS type A sorting domain-containing protein [Ferruginibacter sp.]